MKRATFGPDGPFERSDEPFLRRFGRSSLAGMNKLAPLPEVGARRLPVSIDRVMCWRLGPIELDRCRECVNLLRLEGVTADERGASHVVCAGPHPEPDLDFAW